MIEQMFNELNEYAKLMMAEGRPAETAQELAGAFCEAMNAPEIVRPAIEIVAKQVVERDIYLLWYLNATNQAVHDWTMRMVEYGCRKRGII